MEIKNRRARLWGGFREPPRPTLGRFSAEPFALVCVCVCARTGLRGMGPTVPVRAQGNKGGAGRRDVVARRNSDPRRGTRQVARAAQALDLDGNLTIMRTAGGWSEAGETARRQKELHPLRALRALRGQHVEEMGEDNR